MNRSKKNNPINFYPEIGSEGTFFNLIVMKIGSNNYIGYVKGIEIYGNIWDPKTVMIMEEKEISSDMIVNVNISLSV